MTDTEKVIKGLETCAGTNNDGDDCTADCLLECPYKGSLCIDRLMYDALALLKEQEAQFVQNIAQQISCKSGLCPNCGKMLNMTCNKKFCGDCGQAVKWE